ncbi:hypothetical protein A1Q2_00996 [Trichosporon asahii var. asahii CBS 8904]|uniref:Uncharacterized protein n=1 Tax=Trichosporon asahii var. asahii (strain CBS 8904) TaxID=1220162 RepID=K1VW17_TRIAC|nr:hypothetical protein A1Q2_00996 [Trichosporon asahii var. asahii CBS 8904]
MSFASNPSMFEALRAIVVASAAAPDDDPTADAAVSAAIRKLYPDIPEPPQRNPNAPRSLDELTSDSEPVFVHIQLPDGSYFTFSDSERAHAGQHSRRGEFTGDRLQLIGQEKSSGGAQGEPEDGAKGSKAAESSAASIDADVAESKSAAVESPEKLKDDRAEVA